jgi:hypothetical protein
MARITGETVSATKMFLWKPSKGPEIAINANKQKKTPNART